MLWGAAIGDIVGSRFEFDNYKAKDFVLFGEDCTFTDDTVLTAAVADALIICRDDPGRDLAAETVEALRRWTEDFPGRDYGEMYLRWVQSDSNAPYGSFGNGAAMRVSPCGWAAVSLEEAEELARTVTAVTHSHPQAVHGAQAVAGAVYLARTGASREKIRAYIEGNFYCLDFTLDAIRPYYTFSASTQGSVPQALEAFFESIDFDDAVRSAVSIGGDSDTIAAIAGSVAGAFYPVPQEDIEAARGVLDPAIVSVFERFAAAFGPAVVQGRERTCRARTSEEHADACALSRSDG